MAERRQGYERALDYVGNRVEDVYGARMGTLEDVLYDPESGRAVWLLVRVGRWSARYATVPLRDWIPSQGSVWIPIERRVVQRGPGLDAPTSLTRELELSLCDHYGLPDRAREIEGRPSGSHTARLASRALSRQPRA